MTRNVFRTIAVYTTITLGCLCCASSLAQETQVQSPGDRGYGLRNHRHRDNPKLIAQWDSLLRRHDVDLYLSGHDHDLQHLEFKGHPTSFVISGGGGAELVGWTTSPQARGPSGLRALGFTDLQISKKGMVVDILAEMRPSSTSSRGRSTSRGARDHATEKTRTYLINPLKPVCSVRTQFQGWV
jgi:hypothetical protein